MRSIVIDNCQLELDTERGVLYVHHPDGFTALRICRLPKGYAVPYSSPYMIDITIGYTKTEDIK